MREWMDEEPLITFLGKYTPIAAKEYECQICGEKINIGTKYKKHVIKNHDNGGKIETYRMCFLVCNVMG